MRTKLIFLLFSLLFTSVSGFAQKPSFRFAINTGGFINEIGAADNDHPMVEFLQTTETSDKFSQQLVPGIEAEVILPFTEKMSIGVELENLKLKGYNDTPPIYNFYFTDYNRIADYLTVPVAFETRLTNIAGTWRYYLGNSSFNPFVKLLAGVAFIGTDFTIKNDVDASIYPSNVIYSRGTSNDEQTKWPAFYLGGGLGFNYQINDNVAFQVDGALTMINSDIVNGVPNFNYENVAGYDQLKHQNNQSLGFRLSAGIKYSLDAINISSKKSSGKSRGRSSSSSHLPFAP